MFDDRNGGVFVSRLVLFVLVGVDIPCRFFRVKLDRCFPPYKYLAKCRGARPIRPCAPSTFLYFNSGRHAPAYIKRIEGKKYSILPKISQNFFLSKAYKIFYARLRKHPQSGVQKLCMLYSRKNFVKFSVKWNFFCLPSA